MSNRGLVLIVDDDACFRTALGRLLVASGFEVREFASAAEVLVNVPANQPACVVADLQMPGLNGLELQEALARTSAALPFLFLTGHGDLPNAVRAMRRGALDFLEKCAPKDQLIAAIDGALASARAAHAQRTREDELRRLFARLTARELEVLTHVVRGRLNKQIAFNLGIQVRTVKVHRGAITTKIGVRSVAELTTLAHEAHVFSGGDASP